MKTHHRCTVTLVLAAGAWHAAGQTAVDLSRQGKLGTGTTLPVRCTVGQVFFKTDASAGANLYACTTPNTWSAMGLPVLGGDASGTQQSMVVQGIQGRSVSAASPADQNVLRWNATTGRWEPGPVPTIGTAGPPSTCAAGSLYLRSDAASNIQQLYVCSSTNTWTMASTGSGLAASRPVNCTAGQTWLSTDTGAMTYCSVTGSPGTWSATLAGPQGASGPQGPVGPAGNTILSGAGAPPAGTGSNGDFYLNTTASCLYGPKASGAWPGSCTALIGSPNFTATSGASTMSAAFSPTGSLQSYVEPFASIPGSGNLQAGMAQSCYLGGLFNPANYGNLACVEQSSVILNGRNSSDNSDKKTISGNALQSAYVAAGGQVAGLNETLYHYGVGDSIGASIQSYAYGNISAPGDEGGEGVHVNTWGPEFALLQTSISSLTKTTCNTSLTQSIAKSTAPTDIKTFTVASTSGCIAGDWITIDQGVFESTDTNVDTVRITAVGGGTISALLQAAHNNGAPVAPAPVIAVGSMGVAQGWGQGRNVVDLAATAYTTGTADVSGFTVTGHGTTWSNSVVGGDINLPGCISFPVDNQTTAPWSVGSPLVSWFPIQSIGSSSSLTLARPYPFPQTGTTYIIRPCARVGALALTYGSTTESISGIVLESNAFPWTSGHSVEQTVTPYGTVQGTLLVGNQWNSKFGGANAVIYAWNAGYSAAKYGIQFPPSTLDSATAASLAYGLTFQANTGAGAINIVGKDLTGNLINKHVFNNGGVRDDGAINWTSGGDGPASAGNTATGQSFIAHDTVNGYLYMGDVVQKLKWGTYPQPGNPTTGVLWDYTAIPTNATTTITIPNASGTLCLTTTCPGPTTFTRLVPDGQGGNPNEIDIGTVPVSYAEDFLVQLTTFDNGTSERHARTYAFGIGELGGAIGWTIIPPLTDTGPPSGSDFTLEASIDSSHNVLVRLRHSSGTASIYVFGQMSWALGPGSTIPLTPSTTTHTVSAPTLWAKSATITQQNHKLLLTNASGLAATIDPTNLTAPRTITLPNAGGTPLLYQGATTGSTAFAPAGANCPATNCVTPYTWMQVTTPDGSTGYMPVFK
jgi:hypothetical protein